MLDATNAWTPAGGVSTPAGEATTATATWSPSLGGLADIGGVGLGLLIAIALLAYWYRRVL